MKSPALTILLSLFLTYANSFTAAADEVTDVVNEVAEKLIQQLPMDKKIALKSLSPEETGLPDEFLRKLVSDFEASLLTASAFEIKLLNRNATEEIWSDAIEFGDSKFEEIYKASEASILILLSPRVSPVGLEINAAAYELKGDSSGMLIASSGNQKIVVDLQEYLGVNINTIEDNIRNILADLDELSKSTQRIESPETYSEFIHNARYSEQNNQVIEAIKEYAAATEVNSKFADPYLKIAQLANFQFGSENAIKFVRSQHENLSGSELQIIELALGESKISDFDILQKRIEDPVILSLWLNLNFRKNIPKFSECSRLFFSGQTSCSRQESFVEDVSKALAIRVAIKTITKAVNAGYFSQVFLDPRLQNEYVKEDQYLQFSLSSQDHFNILELFQDVINSAHSARQKGSIEQDEELQLEVFSPIIDRFSDFNLDGRDKADFAITLAINLERAGYLAASSKIIEKLRSHVGDISSYYQYDILEYSDYLANFYRFTTSDRGGKSAILATRENLLTLISENYFDSRAFLKELDRVQPNGDYRFAVYRSMTEAFIIPKLVREGHIDLANRFVLNILTRENFGIFVNGVKPDPEAISLALVGYIYSINNDEDFLSINSKSRNSAETDSQRVNAQAPAVEASLTCYVMKDRSKITNVQDFTNLRQQAGLGGRVIDQISLDETVRIVDPGGFLRYDRCAASCDGTNQNEIKQCIDDNDVWIEVEYNGRRGFLSRKFLE